MLGEEARRMNMRKIIGLIILGLSFISFSAFAEECTEVFNANGQITKRTCANDITTYSYSTKNGETSVTMTKYAKTPKGKQGITLDYLKTTYNADESVKETESRSYDNAGTRVGGIITQYQNGLVVSLKNETYQGSKNLLGYSQTSYAYDEQGRVLSENTVTKEKDSSGNMVQTASNERTYEYNESGSYQVYENGEFVGRYNKSGTLIESKKIYTVEEASALSKQTGNKVRLRYK